MVHGISTLPKTCVLAASALAIWATLSVDVAAATKKKPPAITQEQAKKICIKAYGVIYKAVVRNGQVICYI